MAKLSFLRRVVPGPANKSYGIEVARIAGVPESVLERAREILTNLEQNELDLTGKTKIRSPPQASEQILQSTFPT
jgi:DNA mismatch repair protein MutS